MSFNMYVPTRVIFGQGKLNELEKQNLPGKKAMIVISNGKSTRANGYLEKTQRQLQKAGSDYVVFDKIQPNPLKDTVNEGGVFARENQCDYIVALGGGSVMDAAKGIAVVATNGGDVWDYIAGGTGGKQPISKEPLPIVAITTTAGTGSETDAGGVISNPYTKEKTALVHPSLFPVLAIVDPELMLTVPPAYTAYQGFDALFHSIEGYVCNAANLMSDMYAITAIEHVGRNLVRAVKNGNDIEAREKVAFGNTLSGVVMCVGRVTSQHSLEHAMSAYHQDLPHGAGLIMLSKAYFTHLIENKACDERFVSMAKALGMTEAKEPMDFITALVKLQEECNVADLKMSDYGIKKEDFPVLAQNAKDTMAGLFVCDRIALSNDDCIAIYEKSYK